MKNYKKIFIFIVLLVLFIPSNVYAFMTKITNYRSPYSSPLYALTTTVNSSTYYKKVQDGLDANGNPKYVTMRHMSIGIFETVINEKKYPAVCIDPGYYFPDGVELTCSKLEEGGNVDTGAIRYIMNNLSTSDDDSKWTVATTVVRYFAFPVSQKNRSAISIQRITEQKSTDVLGVAEYETCDKWPTETECFSAALQDFRSGKSLPLTTQIIQEIKDAKNYSINEKNGTAFNEQMDFKFTPSEPDNDGYIEIKVEASGPVPDNVNFTCKQGCVFVNGVLLKGRVITKIRVKINKGECPTSIPYVIGYSYKPLNAQTEVKSIYKCYSNASETQRFIVMVDDKTAVNQYGFIEGEENLKYTCNDLCSTVHIDDNKSVNMCCTDNGNQESYIIQPLIRDLFCEKKQIVNGVTKFKVPGYGVSEQVAADSKEKDVNTYCTLYCTERLHIKIPGAQTGNNGKYFSFSGSNPDDKGPYFNGYKTCRLRIKYDKWQSDYVSATENAINKYNAYQQAQALANSYHQAWDDMTSAPYKNKTVGGTAHYYTSWISDSVCDAGGASCSTSESTNCSFKYQYDVDAYTFKSYIYRNVQASPVLGYSWTEGKKLQNFNGLNIVQGNTGTKKGSLSGMYLNPSWNNSFCDSSWSATCSTGCVETYVGTCYSYNSVTKAYDIPYDCNKTRIHTVSGTAYRTGVSRSYGKTEISNDTLAGYYYDKQRLADAANGDYLSSVTFLHSLEDEIKACDTYFDEHNPGYSGSANYQMKPDVQFHYTQVYLSNENSTVVSKSKDNPFNVTCDYYHAEVAYDSSQTDLYGQDLGLEGPNYNTVNSNLSQNAAIYSFKKANASCTVTGPNTYNGCNSGNLPNDLYMRSISQKYTKDAYYRAECKSNGENNVSYSLYPYGSINTSYSANSTYHNAQYFIEYSNLSGKFLTYWEFKNLGTNGKFDNSFVEGETCAKPQPLSDFIGTSGLSCTYEVKASLTRISGCDQNSVVSQHNYINKCCKDSSCKYEGVDIITYAFKTVDPVNIFPDGGRINGTGAEYAYNWLKTTEGQNAYSEITNIAKADKTYSTDRITYEFVLNINDLESVRKYNNFRTYNDNSLTCTCEGTTDSQKGCIGHLKNCYSRFISNWYSYGTISAGNFTDQVSVSYGLSNLSQARSRVHFSS